jgi:hypothetical protein
MYLSKVVTKKFRLRKAYKKPSPEKPVSDKEIKPIAGIKRGNQRLKEPVAEPKVIEKPM